MKRILVTIFSLAILFVSCVSDEQFSSKDIEAKKVISLGAEIKQVPVTRVNDDGFCDGDVMGIYVVDYQGENPGTLLADGNRADNWMHTFDEAAYKWNSAYDVYFKDEKTPVDIYGYYPYSSPEDVNEYSFTVQQDQSTEEANGLMGGYEASDFLWGKVVKVMPTENKIRLPFYHRMSGARIELIEGEGFDEGEWNMLEKYLLLRSVVRESKINLATGEVTPSGNVEAEGTIPYKRDDSFRAIVVPQTVGTNMPLFSITIGTVPYSFSKGEPFTYIPGKLHKFTIRVDKKNITGDYSFTLAGEAITAWENDDVSHDATMREYIVIESQAGMLKESIIESGKDFRKLEYLKITGEANAKDFYFMRDSMDVLRGLNLKETIIRGMVSEDGTENNDYQIPASSFYFSERATGKESLTRVILPDKLVSIGARAFDGCKYLSGSLIIPEGVVDIQQGAFHDCRSLDGTLSLPSTLKYLGNNGNGPNHETEGEGIDYYGGVFQDCQFVSELKLPDGLEIIRGYCFSGNSGLYGELRLPDKLRKLGQDAFSRCSNLTGSLTIPQGVTIIQSHTFHGCGFNGNLQLHDGITAIGTGAFELCPLKGELDLPEGLAVLSDVAFAGCDFSGKLELPSGLIRIGANVFGSEWHGANWRLSGVLEIPEGVVSIGEGAFYNCTGLEGIVFPEGLESIRNNAFFQCYGIGSIVSKSAIPPHIMGNAFDGVPKDNFTLEVPESSITLYQTESGWMDFKRISAHRELVCRPALANALNTESTRRLVLNAEGEWYVESIPEWCELSQMEGTTKTELTLTIKEMAAGAGNRTGEIVFKLKEKDYTHKCTVSQYDYIYPEDEVITLQKATKGNNGGINLVFLGDGYDAKDISEGKYMAAMEEQVEHFFGIEPYKTYRDYFNVYTAIAVSTETGVGTVNTIRYVKFETTFTGGVGLKCNNDEVFRYVLDMNTTVTRENLHQSLVIITPNSTDYGGICWMWDDGSAIAMCPMSTYGYPFDTRGVIQHEAGGHGFGKLGDEYIYHNTFIDMCGCNCCGHVDELLGAQSLGWFKNLSLSGKMHEVPWNHLIFDERYADIVDIYEGGYMHNRGVFRSEQNSCMNNDIPYYSTISREQIVRRIKSYAGEEFSFEEFVANDSREAGVETKSVPFWSLSTSLMYGIHKHPQILKGSPLKNE